MFYTQHEINVQEKQNILEARFGASKMLVTRFTVTGCEFIKKTTLQQHMVVRFSRYNNKDRHAQKKLSTKIILKQKSEIC